MRLGDLIDWGGRRWVVRRLERQTKTAIIHDGGAVNETISDTLKWPSVVLPQRSKLGRLLSLSKPHVNGTVLPLVLFHDWMIADPLQPGGAVFFNPSLGLRLGDLLVATYQRGSGRVAIPREFLSAAQVRARSEQAVDPTPTLSIYDRLRHNPYEDDD